MSLFYMIRVFRSYLQYHDMRGETCTMNVCKDLKPQKVFAYFEELTRIPHGSRNTRAISDYLMDFAYAHGLEAYQDASNNVIMIQEATPGYESAEPVILQGHMDMVCEKERDCTIDFEKDALDLCVEGDFLKARGTTLGGDDGIAVAYALALLDSPELAHPRLEVILTTDEEIGMLGAADIDLSMLKGRRMLNLDSETEGEFLTSCAGGMSVNASIPVRRHSEEGRKITITVSGLLGGHSGGEIDKERANAVFVMARVLHELQKEEVSFGILSMAGGLKDNAIPRDCMAELLIPAECTTSDDRKHSVFQTVKNVINRLQNILSHEFAASDPGIMISCEDCGVTKAEITDLISTEKLIFLLRQLPNGVMHRSTEIEGLVETSLNLGILKLTKETLQLVISIRSSVSSRKSDLADRVCQMIEMFGGRTKIEGDYPAWEYVSDSALREVITKVYRECYGTDPVYNAIHAGLECGLLSEKLSGLDCVSFGPQMYDIHTPQERLSISSVGRVWEFLIRLLEALQ